MTMTGTAVRLRHISAIRGPNFSGRTALIGSRCEQACASGGTAAYVGPEIYGSLSGLASTVEAEIRLQRVQGPRTRSVASADDGPAGVDSEIADTLAPLATRNPGTLSGGEQALLAVACALAGRHDVIGFDCCLEQLDARRRSWLLSLVDRSDLGGRVLWADNRVREAQDADVVVDMSDVPPDRPSIGRLSSCDGSHDAATLALQGVSFAYRAGRPVLRDLTATLEPGQVYRIYGKNGAGKSTLARLLVGELRPSVGAILHGGRLVRPWREPAALVGYHFQNPDVQLFCTRVDAEVQAGARTAEAAAASTDALGLGAHGAEHPLDLPFVLRKRVALAATLAMRRPWMVFDEPTLGQDDGAADSLAALLAQLARAGHGIVVISHSDSFCAMLGARQLEMVDGSLTG